MRTNTPEYYSLILALAQALSSPAVFHNASNGRFEQNAVTNAELKEVTGTLARLEVEGEVRHKFAVEDPHLVTCCIRDDHLSHMTQLPIIQFFDHPVGDIARVVTFREWSTTQHKSLSLPVRINVVWWENNKWHFISSLFQHLLAIAPM